MSLPLSNEELQRLAPSLFTQVPHHEVSDKYHFIPTIEVIEEIRFHRWYPVSVQESQVRKSEKEGFQRHLVRFRHFDDLLNPPQNAVELLLFNSHDRSTAFSVSIGVYHFVCANGLIVADTVLKLQDSPHRRQRERYRNSHRKHHGVQTETGTKDSRFRVYRTPLPRKARLCQIGHSPAL